MHKCRLASGGVLTPLKLSRIYFELRPVIPDLRGRGLTGRAKDKLALIVVLLFILLLTGCGQAAPNGSAATGRDVAIDQALADWKNKSAIILDVRTPGEYAEGHIPGAKLIPLDQLPSRLSEVPKEGKIYIICRSGNRSNQATSILRDKGFSNVYNVTSGMTSWKGPVEK